MIETLRKEKDKEMNDVFLKEEKKGFTIIQNEFLAKWVKAIGLGPAMLYLQLLSYCYGDKDIAYPSLKNLANRMGVSIKTVVVYREVLIAYGLIKKIMRRKDENGSYQTTLYQLVRFNDKQFLEEKIDEDEEVVSGIVEATKEDTPKLRDSLDKKNDSLLQQLKDLGITPKMANQLLQYYPEDKIKGKLYLLRKKDIHNPGAYLLSVLRNDYANKEIHNSEDEITSEEIDEINRKEGIARSRYYREMEEKALPREESLKWIQRIRQQLRDGKMSCEDPA